MTDTSTTTAPPAQHAPDRLPGDTVHTFLRQRQHDIARRDHDDPARIDSEIAAVVEAARERCAAVDVDSDDFPSAYRDAYLAVTRGFVEVDDLARRARVAARYAAQVGGEVA